MIYSMSKSKLYALLLFVGTIIFSCQPAVIKTAAISPSKSTVLHFEYHGYSDTIFAIVYGSVFTQDSLSADSNALSPLKGVTITAIQNKKITQTDELGQFSIGLEKGVFSLLVSKPGYQPLTIVNYMSDPDQVSDTKIVLVKGTTNQYFKIPDKKE